MRYLLIVAMLVGVVGCGAVYDPECSERQYRYLVSWAEAWPNHRIMAEKIMQDNICKTSEFNEYRRLPYPKILDPTDPKDVAIKKFGPKQMTFDNEISTETIIFSDEITVTGIDETMKDK